MSHYILKLSSGEFVYGVINPKKSDQKIITMHNPMVWEEYTTQDGYTGTALVRYMTGTTEEIIPISTSHVTSMAKMSETFSGYYDAAVACNKITDESYEEKLAYMTKKITEMVVDHQLKVQAAKTGGIAFTENDISDTIH